jgi:hypothetical protein
VRRRPTVELGEVSVEVCPAFARGVDHRRQPPGLGLEGLDLSLDAVARVLEDRATLVGVLRGAEELAVALAGGLVLEELADLGEREAGVVAQLLDGPQPLEVRGVVQAIGPAGPCRRLEEPDLLVITDRAARQAGLGGDLLDLEEARRGLGRRDLRGHQPILPQH